MSEVTKVLPAATCCSTPRPSSCQKSPRCCLLPHYMSLLAWQASCCKLVVAPQPCDIAWSAADATTVLKAKSSNFVAGSAIWWQAREKELRLWKSLGATVKGCGLLLQLDACLPCLIVNTSQCLSHEASAASLLRLVTDVSSCAGLPWSVCCAVQRHCHVPSRVCSCGHGGHRQQQASDHLL